MPYVKARTILFRGNAVCRYKFFEPLRFKEHKGSLRKIFVLLRDLSVFVVQQKQINNHPLQRSNDKRDEAIFK